MNNSAEDRDDEVELQQLLMELQQLTKRQTSYSSVLLSLNERQSVVNDKLLQLVTEEEGGRALIKLKDMSQLERDNYSLRKKVDELTKAERQFDARMTDLRLKLSESTSQSKRLLRSKQEALKDVDELKAELDSSRLDREQQRIEVDHLKASVEEMTSEKRRLQQRVRELTADVEKVLILQRETAELKEKLATMERLQALRSLRELEDTSANDETEKMRLELIEETAGVGESDERSGR